MKKSITPILAAGLFLLFTALQSCQKEVSCENCTGGNQPPVANAGPDQVIYFPADSVLLDGAASADPDGTISQWSWTKISGPAAFSMVSPSMAQNMVRGLDTGVYRFSLRVTDNGGLTDADTVEIRVVHPATQPNRPPVARAGPDQVITLPVNAVTLDGTASSDPDNNITGYLWRKISGPSSFSLVNPVSVQTQATGLAQGDYLFELSVTDAGGLTAQDTVRVTVNPHPGSSFSDIYVAGTLNDQPVYWKNGQVNYLNGGDVGFSGTSVAVSASTIAFTATKYELLWSHYAARYWKNGVAATVGSYATANAVAVSGNDVYVAGWEWTTNGGWAAKYWKNGQEVLLGSATHESVANAIVVVGTDVYVAGTDGNVAKYWKNGQAVSLTNGASQAYAASIAVVGTDVYVAGGEFQGTYYIAKYWKNGQEVQLSNGPKSEYAMSIAVAGNDVYVAGREGDILFTGADDAVAKYWKNGQAVTLTSPNTLSYAQSIAIHGTDVYVAGVEYNGTRENAKYWINGQPVSLTNGTGQSVANCIVVVNR